MSHILILGGTTFDHIVYLEELPWPVPKTIHQAPFNEAVGSTGSGKALNLAKLGVSNTLFSAFGDDYYGEKILAYFQEEKIDLVYETDPKGTERHINIMDAEGQRISMFVTQSSSTLPFNLPKIEGLIKNADIIILNIIPYCKPLIPLLQQYNKPVWTDLHDYDGKSSYYTDFIAASQYIHLSSDNLPAYKPLMQELIAAGKELVICTHGKLGASALTKTGEWIDEPALTNYPIEDSNGAGDSFFSGFLYGYLQEKPISYCMKLGTICAALCIGSRQLAAAALSPLKLDELYKQHYI